MQSYKNVEKSKEWQGNFKQWISSFGWTLCYSFAICAVIMIPLNGIAHVLGAGLLK